MAEKGLTADGDAQLHTTPLRQLHVERTTARDDRLWVQRDRDPCETQLHIHSGLAGRDPHKVTFPTPSWFSHLTDEETEAGELTDLSRTTNPPRQSRLGPGTPAWGSHSPTQCKSNAVTIS